MEGEAVATQSMDISATGTPTESAGTGFATPEPDGTATRDELAAAAEAALHGEEPAAPKAAKPKAPKAEAAPKIDPAQDAPSEEPSETDKHGVPPQAGEDEGIPALARAIRDRKAKQQERDGSRQWRAEKAQFEERMNAVIAKVFPLRNSRMPAMTCAMPP